MKKFSGILLVMLALPTFGFAQSAQPKPVSKKSPASPTKPANSPIKPAEQSPRITYAELTIDELVAEDANRWSDKMATRVAVGGFVTQVTKGDDGDTELRICENPKIENMDRNRCIVPKCIPKLPCDLPQVGKPVTVKGIAQYDAKAGAHWWEIHPIEQVEK